MSYKQGEIGMEVDATAVKGDRGYSISSIVFVSTSSDGKNTYNVFIEDGSNIGQIVTNRGLSIAALTYNRLDSDGNWIYDVTIEGGTKISEITVPKGNGIKGVSKISEDKYSKTYEFTFDDGSTYSFSIPNGRDAFEMWEDEQPDKPDGTDYTLEEFFEAYRGYSIKSVDYKETLANGDNVYNVILDDGNNTIIGTITTPKGNQGWYIDTIILKQIEANGDRTYNMSINDSSGTIVGTFTVPKGDQGTSISSVTYKQDEIDGSKTYNINLSDGTIAGTITAPKGEKGDKGDTGATGLQGPTGPQGPKGTDGVLADAPADGNEYVRKDNSWTQSSGGGKTIILFDYDPSSSSLNTIVILPKANGIPYKTEFVAWTTNYIYSAAGIANFPTPDRDGNSTGSTWYGFMPYTGATVGYIEFNCPTITEDTTNYYYTFTGESSGLYKRILAIAHCL